MDAVCDGVGDLTLHYTADDGFEDGFDEPGDPGEFALAELVLDFMDVDADGFEGEDFLKAFFADFDVERYVHAALVELEGCDAFVCEVEYTAVGAEPEADFVGADGETVEGDGDEGGGGGGGAEGVGFANFEVVVGFDAELVGEERRLVYGAAGFDDEIFEKEVDLRDRNLKAGDGYILDAVNEQRDEDVDCIVNQLLICGCMERGEDLEDLFGCSDKVGDILVSKNGIESCLHLF